MKYYTTDEIKSKKDLDGLEPSIFLITSNRSAGKTTCLLDEAFKIFIEDGKKTVLIYRHKYELTSAITIFSESYKLLKIDERYTGLKGDFKSTSYADGLFYEILLDGMSFAYAVALSNVDALKKYSPIFSLVDLCVMDEFQKEDGKYLPREVEKLQSLLITIARGGGQQSRPIKCFLLGNNISMLNPYFIFFNITKRYRKGTKFIRGKGWIAEFNFNVGASEAIKANGIHRAFSGSDYMSSASDNVTLFNEEAFIEKITGKQKYLFTIKHDGKLWGVREELKTGIVYVNDKHDSTCKNILAFSTGEHGSNTVMLSKNSFIMKKLKESYELGMLRFANLNAKNVIFDILSLDLR